MERNCYRNLFLFQIFGCLIYLTIASVQADGRVFLLESTIMKNTSNEAVAQGMCSAQGARLATAEELRHAVTECSFSVCARGWMAGPSIGTIVCHDMGGSQSGTKVVDVIVENATSASLHLDVFCIKDKDDSCGDPPSFPHTTLQGHTGWKMGDELLYTCVPGYVMPNGRTVFSLLCDSCGAWYGLVQLCVKDKTVPHIDYEDKFPDESHFSIRDTEEVEEEESEGGHFSDSTHNEELDHAVHQGVEQEGVAHENLDNEGKEQGRAAPESADDRVFHERDPDKDVVYEGADQGDVAPEIVNHEHMQEQDTIHEEFTLDGEEQKLGDRPEKGSMTEIQERPGLEGSRDMLEDEVEEIEDTTESRGQHPTMVTDTPVSILSQKHLFWFPSETFHEEKTPEDKDKSAPVDTDSILAKDGNHTELKSSDDDSGQAAIPHELDDFDIGHPTGKPQNRTKGEAAESIASSDKSLLDGHPIILDVKKEEEEGVKVGFTGAGDAEGEDEQEEGVRLVTDSTNLVEIRQPNAPSMAPSDDVTQIVASPTHPADLDINHAPLALTPTSPPDNVISSLDDVESEVTTNSVVEQAEATTKTILDRVITPDFGILDHEVAEPTTAPWETTENLYPFLDHLPGPTDLGDVVTPFEERQESATGFPDELAGTSRHDVRVVGNMTLEGAGERFLPTEEPCMGDACSSGVGRGLIIAITIVAICTLITATALAIWCYRKRQLKNSVYKMNGKGQSQQAQQIEMQQKV